MQARLRLILSALCVLPFVAGPAHAQWDTHRPDSHAPIGVMGDHVHHAGEFMFSYRYMHMVMDGNYSGTKAVSDASVLGSGFMITPTEMTMDMHMFGAMWAPTDGVTYTAMLPYSQISMEHLTGMGGRFKTESEGVGDLRLGALIPFAQTAHTSWHFNAGISAPTGSINQRGDTPAGPNQLLPYPMQLGSGTWNVQPGVTWLGQCCDLSWGAQAIGTFPLGQNNHSYALGDRGDATAWGAWMLADWLSVSGRVAGAYWGNIEGSDPGLASLVGKVPTASANMRAGKRVDAGVGLNFYIPRGGLHGVRLAVEFLVPVYQNLDGPQLGNDYTLVAGLQVTF